MGAQTRDRLIEVAIEAFARNGFEGTSSAQIAEMAGVSQPTVNYHFGTKRELYEEVIRTCVARWAAALEVGRDLRSLEPLDQLKVSLRRLGEEITENRSATRVVHQAAMSEEYAPLAAEAMASGHRGLVALFQQLIDDGRLRPVPAYLPVAAMGDVFVNSVIAEPLKTLNLGLDFSDPEVRARYVDGMIDLLFRGLVPAHDAEKAVAE